MKKFHERIVEYAREQASRSSHTSFTHGAVLLHRSKILASGFNHHAYHAERDVFKNLKKTLAKKEGYIVFVVRINKSGELRSSKPCANCMSYLKFQNVHCVFFSCEDGAIHKLQLQ